MSKIHTILAAGLVATPLFAASNALAQEGFYMDGSVLAAYNGGFGDMVDVTLGYDGIAGLPMGLEIYATDSRGAGTPSSSFAGAFYYDTALGRFSVGLPKSALDDYVSLFSFGHNPDIVSTFAANFLDYRTLNFPQSPGDFKVGVRFDGTAGGVDYGLSYTALTGGVYSVSGGARYRFGSYYTVAAGFENSPEGGSNRTRLSASFAADYDSFGFSIMAKQGLQIIGGGVLYTARGYYDWNNFEAFAEVFGDGLSTPGKYNVGVEYTFMDNGYVGVEVSNGGFGGGTPAYNIYAGWNIAFGG